MMARAHRRRLGLTLVELAIAIALVATLATVAAPYFANWAARHRVTAAAETLRAELSEARLLAARKGQTSYLAFSTGAAGDWCWAVSLSSGCPCATPAAGGGAAGCRLRNVDPREHRGVALAAAQDAQFTPEGLGQGSAELRSARGHVLRVDVSRLGRSGICAAGGEGLPYPPC